MKLKEAATGDLSGGQQYHEALKYGDVPLLPSFEPHSDDNIYRSIATTIEGKPNDYILPGKVENPVTFFTNASKVNSYHANAGGAGPKTEIQYTPDIFEKTAITDRGDSVIPNTPQKIMDIKDSTYSDLRDEDKPLKIIQTQNTIHDVLDDTVLKSFNRAFPDISFDPGRNGFNPHNLVQIGNHPMFGKYKVMTLSADIIDHLSKTKNPLYDTGFKLAKRDRKFNQHIKDITSTFPGASRADIEQLAFKATIMDYTELSMHENTIHNVPKNILGWIKQFKNYIANLVGANPNKLDSMTLQNLSEHILKDLASIGSLTKSTFK
jgi:hypothetical protein